MNRTIRIAHLVFGLLFLGIATVWLLDTTNVIGPHDLAISGPVVLIAAGVVGLVVSLASSRRSHRPAEFGYDDPSPTATQHDTIDDVETQEKNHE
jgi:hypothetical protein